VLTRTGLVSVASVRVLRDVRLLREHRPACVVHQAPPFRPVDHRTLAPAKPVEDRRPQTGKARRGVRPLKAAWASPLARG
jgi:hypothetical protein